MKIIGKSPVGSTFYRDVATGTVLRYTGFVCIKDQHGRLVRLRDGVVFDPRADWIVETVYPDAALYLHGAPNE